MDGNFKAEHLHATNPDDEVYLMDGRGFMVGDSMYKEHLSKAKDNVQRSECNNHRAVNQANATCHGLEAMGISGCACARHGCFVPHAMVDFQKGERQMNMDYALCKALKHNADGIRRALTFYDVNCQYHRYLKDRIANSPVLDICQELEIIPGIGSCYVRYASNFIEGAGRIDGEIMETLWALLFKPEKVVIPMPSNMGPARCAELGVADLIHQEVTLREGQANDALHSIRVHLADKAIIFRKTVRVAKSQATSTRAWAQVHSVDRAVSLNASIYSKCRSQLGKLGADIGLLEREDLKVSTAVADPNARGQRNNQLAWFWSMDVEGDSDSSDWLNEFYRVHWLRTKALRDRWVEELLLVQHEMNWTCDFFLHKAEQWICLAAIAKEARKMGHLAYAGAAVQNVSASE
ncbi:hypothetical protein DFJ58DRAFT_713869 [Suillus subalutaceus]|uniref:uncharacterized protein n=1 Tax=Suillus subalutaceus TaxID=48586 RepID=UPI001B85EB4E|nr:uncharacterized protein DFJ58DRAFT_713869 [Suillus subalutaceus]KAG1871356.1 hypothetical protein DFJ58DRAFT_713869 [Suillus subalutaceus]